VDFLIAEARLLDHNQYSRWATLLAEDLHYRMPVRRTVRRRDGLGYDPVMTHFDDDHPSMSLRIRRLEGDNAWSEDPPSRTRRFVSNVQVFTTDAPDEFEVESYVLLTRSAKDDTHFDLVPAERHDLIRLTATGFQLARRTIYIDQTRVGTPNFAVFL
jgi:3-phenylpropionate/cinnamic acid dioxygenase small subunit